MEDRLENLKREYESQSQQASDMREEIEQDVFNYRSAFKNGMKDDLTLEVNVGKTQNFFKQFKAIDCDLVRSYLFIS